MRRREFITHVGGTAAAWPLAARGQQSMRRVAVIMVNPETDPLGQARLKAFLQGFEKLGWTDGRNIRLDIRWANGSAARMQEIVKEIVAQNPDLIVANGTPTVAALKRATSTIPVVFVGYIHPFRPRRFPSSSPMPRRIRASSPTVRAASAGSPTSPLSYSSRRPAASTFCTCPIAASSPRSPICSAGRCRSSSSTWPRRLGTLALASCALSR
jgi:ABC transporter substrate binding protein